MYGSDRPTTNRRMFTLDNTIIIVANIDDNLEEHKKIIEEVVNQTNKKYLDLRQKTKEEHERVEKEKELYKAKLADFKEKATKLYQ